MKKKLSILFNFFIVIFEVFAIVMTLNVNKKIGLQYYTEDSNILALLSSFLYLVYLFLKKEIPRWLKIFKYATTVCLMVTIVVVVFILAPMYNFSYEFFLFNNAFIFQHFICPIFAILTFVFFDDFSDFDFKECILALSLGLIYQVVIVLLNLSDVLVGPYPFLMIKRLSVLGNFFWWFVMGSISFMASYFLRLLNNSYNN